MARLSAKERRALPSSDYALSGDRFPVEDRGHAEAALRDVGRALKARSITPAEAHTVERRAEAKLGKGDHQHRQAFRAGSSGRSSTRRG